MIDGVRTVTEVLKFRDCKFKELRVQSWLCV